MVTKKKDYFDIDEHLEKLNKESASYDTDQLLKEIGGEFDRGDFSSLDPNFPCKDFIKAMERDEKRIKEWNKNKNKKRKLAKTKEKTIEV